MTRRLLFLALPLLFAVTTALADLHIESVAREIGIDGDGNVPVTISVVNSTADTVANVRLTATLFDVTAADGWTCSKTTSPPGVACTLNGPLAPHQTATLSSKVHFDAIGRKNLDVALEGDVGATHVRAGSREQVVLYRRFLVTQTGDSGAGSLRAAIDAMNADATCASLPCGIDFDILASAAVQTITLKSPLARITARDVTIDGSSQAFLHPNNVVVIDGGGTEAIEFFGNDSMNVTGLTLRNFALSAILVRMLPRASTNVMVTNSVFGSNFRSITIGGGYIGSASLIRDNALAANIRSAIFDYSEHNPGFPLVPVLRIERNHINDNGASGIFLGEGSDGALIVDNIIERNRDFGIAVARGAREVRILANSISHNGQSAIDVGLDGPSLKLFTDNFNSFDRDAAVIDSARYDAATNTTIITGRPSVTPITICDLCGTKMVSLYANDAADHGEFAEAQTYLGEATPSGNGWTFTFNGDLRGKYITALATRWLSFVGSSLYDTGELSKAVRVQ
jgi:hypothetical protein